jgi:hypothetical protein
MMKFNPVNLGETFICAKCVELDSRGQLMSLKRAVENLGNFINFGGVVRGSSEEVLLELKS